jgi:hypothetical protein
MNGLVANTVGEFVINGFPSIGFELVISGFVLVIIGLTDRVVEFVMNGLIFVAKAPGLVFVRNGLTTAAAPATGTLVCRAVDKKGLNPVADPEVDKGEGVGEVAGGSSREKPVKGFRVSRGLTVWCGDWVTTGGATCCAGWDWTKVANGFIPTAGEAPGPEKGPGIGEAPGVELKLLVLGFPGPKVLTETLGRAGGPGSEATG